MDLSQYRDLFISEAVEQIDTINKALLELESKPEKSELIGEIFRSVHTLKGMSATMGYDPLTDITHELENLLDQLRIGALPISGRVIDLLFSAVDTIGGMVEEIARGETVALDWKKIEEVISEISGAVEEIAPDIADKLVSAEGKAGPPDARAVSEGRAGGEEIQLSEAEKRRYLSVPGTRVLRLTVVLDEDCVLKSVRVFMVFRKLAQLGEVIFSIPPVEELEDEKFEREFIVMFATQKMPEAVQRALLGIAEIADVKAEKVLEAGVTQGGEPPEGMTEADLGAVARESVRKSSTIRVNIDRLDRLMALVGEVIVNRARLEEIAAQSGIQELKDTLDQTARLTSELQDEVMKMRMVPVENVFNRFPRMVRDLAKKQGKQVRFLMEGKDIELDRTVLDEISDPLVHLLRNAIDHGVETPEEREAIGKPPVSTVRVSAFRDRNYVAIRVEDDGRGIKASEIFDRALAKGLISAEQREALADSDLLSVLCIPGFSTSEVADDVSGRGVGMDAVKNKVESLGGSVTIDTSPGLGTSATLRLPLTLAIIRALLVGVSDEVFAIPLRVVEEVKIAQPEDIRKVGGKETLISREKVLPLIRLDEVFDCRTKLNGSEPFQVVVIEYGDKRIAVEVHNLIGQREIVVAPLDIFLRNVEGFSGATILGSGRVALVIDPASLVVNL